MANYIQELRGLVGHTPLILNSAAGALLNSHQQVLLQERTDTGNWGFPGGYLEFGESFKVAIRREFYEDAGIQITPVSLLRLMDTDTYTYPNGDQVQPINAFYLVHATAGHLLTQSTSETKQLAFFNLTEPPHFFNRQHAKMYQILQNSLKKE